MSPCGRGTHAVLTCLWPVAAVRGLCMKNSQSQSNSLLLRSCLMGVTPTQTSKRDLICVITEQLEDVVMC